MALLLGLVAAFVAQGARAADTSAGSKNFSVPTSVPNYFSNEAGPLQGPTSETRRGTLYSSSGAAEAPQAARTVAVVVPHSRQHIAMAEPHGRLIRGRVAYDRRGSAVAERRAAAHGRPVFHAVARASSRGRVEHVVARAHTTVHKATHVSSVHHGRG
jgi:hypothetical protein